MTESEQVALIRRGYEAYNRGDFNAVVELLHPEVEWRPPTASPDAVPLHGREEARGYMEPNMFVSQASEPLEIIESGDRVLVVARVSARGAASGLEVEQVNFHLWTVADGLAIRFEVFSERAEAMAALGG